VLWPPNGKTISVIISGSITDGDPIVQSSQSLTIFEAFAALKFAYNGEGGEPEMDCKSLKINGEKI